MHPSDPMYKYAVGGDRESAEQSPGGGAEPRAAQAEPAKGEAGNEGKSFWDLIQGPPERGPPPPAPSRQIATEKPPAAKPAPASGDKVHRQYGVPDELIELLGPPPVLGRYLDQFYKVLAAFAQDAEARRTTDWLIPWDKALLRVELGQLGRGKATTVALHYDRAASEIARQGSLRFIKRDPFARITREFDPRMVEFEEPAVDYDEMGAELTRLGLPRECVWDLAYVVAAPMLEPVEAIEALKRNQLRQLEEDLQRRRDRADRRRAEGGQDEAIDAEFEAVAESEQEPEPPAQPLPSPPVEQTQHATSFEETVEASLETGEVAALRASEAHSDGLEDAPPGLPAGGRVEEATAIGIGARDDGELF